MKFTDFSMILKQMWISMNFQELWEPWLRKNVKMKGKEYFFSYHYPHWPVEVNSYHVVLKFPWLCNHLRLINNKNTSLIWCFDQVFLYSMVFYVKRWTELASNNTISWSVTYKILTYFCCELGFASQIHVSMPRRFMFIFLLKSDGDTPQNIYFNVFVVLVFAPFMAKLTCKILAFQSGSGSCFPNCTVPRWEFGCFRFRLSRLIYARSDSLGPFTAHDTACWWANW